MKIFHVISLITVYNISLSQVQFLKEYDFEKGGYSLLGKRSESDWNKLVWSLGDWYTNDTTVLNQIKTSWTFNEPGKKYSCGYHYDVILCKEGVAIESFSINLNCNEIVGRKGYFYFDPTKLSEFKSKLKDPYSEYKNFENIDSARKYRESILNDSNLIFTTTPYWVSFEGDFNFKYKCQETNESCYDDEESILKLIRAEIKLKYPKEEFELQAYGVLDSKLLIKISCNKSLEEKFNLYSRDPEYDKWEPFSLNLTSYWIKNDSLIIKDYSSVKYILRELSYSLQHQMKSNENIYSSSTIFYTYNHWFNFYKRKGGGRSPLTIMKSDALISFQYSPFLSSKNDSLNIKGNSFNFRYFRGYKLFNFKSLDIVSLYGLGYGRKNIQLNEIKFYNPSISFYSGLLLRCQINKLSFNFGINGSVDLSKRNWKNKGNETAELNGIKQHFYEPFISVGYSR